MPERFSSTEEVARLREEVTKLKDVVLAGRVDPADAAVILDTYQLIKDLIELDMDS